MTSTKTQVRAAILAARRSVSQQTREGEAADLARHLAALIAPRSTVCAYVPVGSEPGSVALIDDLVARHIEVLLPVARENADGTPLPLQWGRYTPGHLDAAPFGLREPPPPRLPAETVTTADVVLVPALAVDRDGARLGRGAGYYDRTLALARPGALLVAVVRDEELVDHLPSEAHDVRMTHALTPEQGLVALGEPPSTP
ncbi:5-formyltetrahydrofolate cyclo-ligase [Mycobacterium sp. 236(2023)]|uniref:5-formyltetrahydrofolate cyclo-ligase n=1 Tax=Mycobacterium sp. 236(2023) TaxID=3038163 RepID=UPI0024152CBC|nr:5-formyltetrahydrofolate cyclo-ligase [Mycobacterium sp. 236(2023)]MDG4665861.1 5-formyltetrahydrofolate cyclo-ligase [Mycobacterium sp. 236(2023)]